MGWVILGFFFKIRGIWVKNSLTNPMIEYSFMVVLTHFTINTKNIVNNVIEFVRSNNRKYYSLDRIIINCTM